MENAVLRINGMNGEACADKVANVLAGIGGVSDVRVSLLNSLASVRYDADKATPASLAGSLAQAGYPAEPAGTGGGCCGGCCGG
ncbi:heavy-metal-associated domain-containing protein [Pseudoduganella aquatica]|uniref:Copper chaperone n=1 Tax=Pseudoduganella aquatica TaxID=2660641 RepID=A0A7X4KNB4_9BURK|nr:heavy-metal-associated domain-containing protein [Pseudoduganella aquatica]MYN10134.1 copper chaperone [Pseudoduganella aquatica]